MANESRRLKWLCRDTWGKGLDGYLQWFYETAVLLYKLLSNTGSIYVHLDWHVAHYAKAVLDEVFGYDHFVNEIAWCYTGPTNQMWVGEIIW